MLFVNLVGCGWLRLGCCCGHALTLSFKSAMYCTYVCTDQYVCVYDKNKGMVTDTVSYM